MTFKLPNFFHVERNFSRALELKKYSLRFRQSSAAASQFFFLSKNKLQEKTVDEDRVGHQR